jgi:hypothetical protein
LCCCRVAWCWWVVVVLLPVCLCHNSSNATDQLWLLFGCCLAAGWYGAGGLWWCLCLCASVTFQAMPLINCGCCLVVALLQGGMVLVSHDFRLIDQVAKEIWVCEKQVGTLCQLLCPSYCARQCCRRICVCSVP